MIVFVSDTATTEIYTLSLHGALPICRRRHRRAVRTFWVGEVDAAASRGRARPARRGHDRRRRTRARRPVAARARRDRKEHTSELQSRQYLVCRLLLEKIKNNILRLRR